MDFGDSSISRQSRIDTLQIDPMSPSWIDVKMKTTLISDKTSLLQLGQASETKLFDWTAPV